MNNQKKITVETPLGNIIAVPACDPDNPGIVLEFQQADGSTYQCALIEATNNETVRLLVWGNPEQEDYTNAFSFENAALPRSEWTMEDDGSYQWVKKLPGGDGQFCFIEYGLYRHEPDEYHVYADVVDLSRFSGDKRASLLNILDGFGYTSEFDVEKQYGNEAQQVMAECVFEHQNIYSETAEILFEGDEEACRKFIDDFVHDEDISNTWCVKALKQLSGTENEKTAPSNPFHVVKHDVNEIARAITEGAQDYFVLGSVEDDLEGDKVLSVAAKRETDEESSSEWFSIHVVDNITGDDCDIVSTMDAQFASVVSSLNGIFNATIASLKKD